jgi:hypothetical protein
MGVRLRVGSRTPSIHRWLSGSGTQCPYGSGLRGLKDSSMGSYNQHAATTSSGRSRRLSTKPSTDGQVQPYSRTN